MCIHTQKCICTHMEHVWKNQTGLLNFYINLNFSKQLILWRMLLCLLFYSQFYIVSTILRQIWNLARPWDSPRYQTRSVLIVTPFQLSQPWPLHSCPPATWGQNYTVLINWTSAEVVKTENCIHFQLNWQNLTKVGKSHGRECLDSLLFF